MLTMATRAEEGKKHPKDIGSPRETSPESLETSLTWCLAQLTKPSSSPASPCNGPGGADVKTGGGKDADRRLRAGQWKALVAIRTQHIKGGGSRIVLFQTQGGLPPLLDILRRPESSRKTLDLALSILANCCTEKCFRAEVRRLDGVSIVVEVLKRHVSVETVENRAARTLGNLAMDPEGSSQVHSAGAVAPLLLCLSLSCSSSPSSPSALVPALAPSSAKLECAQSAARALFYVSDTPANRLALLSQGAMPALAPFLAPEYPPGLRRAALRAIHELTRGCGAECAREVSVSGALAQLGVLASGEGGRPLEELALKTLANLCSQGCLRPLVGSLGVIQKFAEEVKKDPLRSGVFFKALCLCCKEAVNRAKVKEGGGLEVLIGFLAAHQNHPLTRLAILACVDFVYDESALEHLQELGLVPLLVARLVEFAKGEEPSAGKMDASPSSASWCSELMASCLDSFDFSPPEGSRRDEAGKEQSPGSASFLSLRSWLVSEGLISSEGELTESPCMLDGDSPHPFCSPSSSSSSSSSSPCMTPISDAPSSSPALQKPLSSPSGRPKPGRPSPLAPAGASQSLLLQASPTPLLPSCSSTPQPKPPPPSPSLLKVPSPPRKRLRTSSSSSSSSFSSSSSSSSSSVSLVSLDSLPAAPRPAVYQHPYHPEPWTPESPILLLLSRFSHAADPSAALVSAAVFSGLLRYLTRHPDPSGRCFRMLARLSCNPNCLQALVRSGAVALLRVRLCLGDTVAGARDTRSDRVEAKVRQLGQGLLSNVCVQSESSFGSGVLSHIILSGSETDKLYCVLSLPLITSNRVLLKKLLLDSGALILALEPLGCLGDGEKETQHIGRCATFLSVWLSPSKQVSASRLHSLYISLLIGCLSSLIAGSKIGLDGSKSVSDTAVEALVSTVKSPLLLEGEPNHGPQASCPYQASTHDLSFILDDGTLLPANQVAVAGEDGVEEVGSEYFRALLRGGFGEARRSLGEAVPIRDVSRGMLLPVLHHLHGCRLTGSAHVCPLLASLVLGGLTGCGTFQESPLAEAMVGASRFLVPELQRAGEDVCVSLLSNAGSAGHPEPGPVCRGPAHPGAGPPPQVSKSRTDGRCSIQPSKQSGEPEPQPIPKVGDLRTLLPQMYWFSQRHAYPRLGRACLSILLRPQDGPRAPLPPSVSADSLLRLARGADSSEALRLDLLGLATAALS